MRPLSILSLSSPSSFGNNTALEVGRKSSNGQARWSDGRGRWWDDLIARARVRRLLAGPHQLSNRSARESGPTARAAAGSGPSGAAASRWRFRQLAPLAAAPIPP